MVVALALDQFSWAENAERLKKTLVRFLKDVLVRMADNIAKQVQAGRELRTAKSTPIMEVVCSMSVFIG